MILTEVYPGDQLTWVGAVPCDCSANKTFRPKRELSEPFNSKARQVCLLNEERVRHARYEVFHYRVGDYLDNGPPGIDQIIETCRLIEEELQGRAKVLVYVPERVPAHQAFSALCVAAHRVLVRGESAADAVKPWLQTDGSSGLAFFENSWARRGLPAPRKTISVEDCLRALELARDRNWVDAQKFDTKLYRDLWQRYDLSWIVPGQLQVMGDPMSTVMDPDRDTIKYLEPQEGKVSPSFAAFFEEVGVKLIVRLNLPKEPGLPRSYSPRTFTKRGIAHLDTSYDDVKGSVPRRSIIKKIVDKCNEVVRQNENAAVTFHCKAGFGRSVACATTWLVYHHDIPGHMAMIWMRLCRPGSITTPQQAQFLGRLTGKAGIEENLLQPAACCTVL